MIWKIEKECKFAKNYLISMIPRQSNNPTIQLSNYPTIQLSNYPTIQVSNYLTIKLSS